MKYKNIEKFDWLFFLLIVALVFLFVFSVRAQKAENSAEIVAVGGAFTLEKAVTAGGGGKKDNASLSENGTTGQTLAGVRSAGGQFSLYAGFWTPDDFTPTASSAVVGGRILTADGRGIRNVQVTITFPTGEIRFTRSSAFGHYRFTEIPVGETYVISVAAKKYVFPQDTLIRQVLDDVRDADFIAAETDSAVTQ